MLYGIVYKRDDVSDSDKFDLAVFVGLCASLTFQQYYIRDSIRQYVPAAFDTASWKYR
jgi:hypothetical protein